MSAAIVVSLGCHTTRVGYADEGRPTLVLRSLATVLTTTNSDSSIDQCHTAVSRSTQFLTSSMKGPLVPIIPTIPTNSDEISGTQDGLGSRPSLSIHGTSFCEQEQVVRLWTEESIVDHPAAHQEFVNAFMGKLLGTTLSSTSTSSNINSNTLSNNSSNSNSSSLLPPKQAVMIILPAHLYASHSRKSQVLSLVGTFFFNTGVVGQIHVAHSCSCATLGSGLPSAILVDIGFSKTSVAAVSNGLVLHNTVQTEAVGGQTVEAALLVTPLGQEFALNALESKSDQGDVAPSAYGCSAFDNQVQKLKEVLCTTDSAPAGGGKVSAAADCPPSPTSSQCPTPTQLYQGGLLVRGDSARNVALMVVNCRRSMDAELKASLPVVLVGGTAQGFGLVEAMQVELKRHDAVFHKQAPVIGGTGTVGTTAASHQQHPAQAAWLGGALMAGSEAFSDLWVSHGDWNTQGAETILSTRMA